MFFLLLYATNRVLTVIPRHTRLLSYVQALCAASQPTSTVLTGGSRRWEMWEAGLHRKDPEKLESR